MRIAGTENTVQYWTNLGSHRLANITGPISAFKSAQCGPSTGTVCWKSKFSMLAPKLGPAMALYWAESRHYSGKLCCMSKSQCPAQQWHFTGYKVCITLANRVVYQKASVRPTNGPSQVRKSALLRQTVLEVKNSESGPVMAIYWVESRHYFGNLCY